MAPTSCIHSIDWLETTHVKALKSLIQAGAEVNIQNEKNETPLHLSSKNGHVDVITALLASYADKTPRDRDGRTPYYRAKNQDCKNALK